MASQPHGEHQTNGKEPLPEGASDEHEVEEREAAAPESGEAGSRDGSPVAETFSVVGIGASAGGLKAFSQFFDALPEDPGMAFVLVQHLAPNHESELADILQTHTSLPVVQVEDGARAEPGGVYVIPPGTQLSIRDGILHLAPADLPHGHRAPIDDFFCSLAADQGEDAVCIVLSGTGSDGAIGLTTVKEAGGLTLAQDPGEAEYDGMPCSAVGTGLVDVVLPAAELAVRLVELRRSGRPLPAEVEALPEDDSATLNAIFGTLRTESGHDFSRYKESTVLRRIGRRMQVLGVESLADYAGALRTRSDETPALLRDLLISVTSFFRDPEAFKALEKLIPKLFEDKGPDDQVRVWVSGCATGEEAYSIAMLLCEHASRLGNPPDLQVFATDIDEDALAFAREGVYPEAIAADVTPERLDSFFEPEGDTYRVKKSVRENVLFAVHNLLKDPPFSKLDLISCRNLLIYLQRETQQRIFELFAYALRRPGFLFLGSSESVEGTRDLFTVLDKKRRLFRGRDVTRPGLRFPVLHPIERKPLPGKPSAASAPEPPPSVGDFHTRLLLTHHAPPSVIVGENNEILHIVGDASRYLTIPAGEPTHDLLRVVLPDLRPELRTALFYARDKEQTTQRQRISVTLDGDPVWVLLTVRSLSEPENLEGLVQIAFEESLPDTAPLDSGETRPALEHLEDELQRTKDRLQSTIEEYETSNEELKTSNEELLSMNEEMQSTTEELETGREELQSINEELSTVNQELKTKIEELNRANADLQNLINSTDVATLFLDRDLRIKRYTPHLDNVFNIIPSDRGRPVGHLTQKMAYSRFVEDARQVLETLVPVEQEVASEDGRHFLTRVIPYRTADDRIDGVVATFVDITRRQEAEDEANSRAERFRRAIAEAPIPTLLHADDGKILQLSNALTEITGYTADEVTTLADWTRLAYGDGHAEVIADIEQLYEQDGRVDEGEYVIRTKSGEKRVWQFSSSPLGTDSSGRRLAISMAADITERKRIEEERETRVRQQAVVAGLGLYALSETDLQALFDRAVRDVRDTLGADHAKVLELQPDGEALLLRAGVGWNEGLVGAATVPTDEGSQAGYTLTKREPVIVDDLVAEARFQGPALLTEHGVRSGMSVIIGRMDKPFGVFGIHARTVRTFTDADADFLQAVANVLAAAVERADAHRLLESRVQDRTAKLRESEARLRLLYDTISQPGADFDALIRNALERTAELLGLKVGILSRVEDETYTIKACYAPGIELETGHTFPLGKTPCSITLASDGPVVMSDLTDSELKGHPCRELFDIESYIGTPIRVDGKVYGTLNFLGPEPKHPPFSEADSELVSLLARWIEAMLDQAHAAAALRREKEFSEQIIESSFDGILTFDLEHRYTFWSAGMERIAGLKREDVLGRITHEVFPFLEEIGEVDHFRAALRGEHSISSDQPFTVPESGRQGLFEAQYAPIRNADGEVVGGLGVIRETTNQRQLEREVIEAAELERRRIGQDLHDELGQQLTGAAFLAQVLSQKLAAQDLPEAEGASQLTTLINEVIAETRDFSRLLSPVDVQAEGLVDALQELTEQTERVFDIPCPLLTEGDVRVSDNVIATHLFRITQEAVTNAVKHADPSQVTVRLRREDKGLLLQIEDDGIGLDRAATQQSSGLGLRALQYRATLIGASLRIVPGARGTTISVSLPLHSEDEEQAA